MNNVGGAGSTNGTSSSNNMPTLLSIVFSQQGNIPQNNQLPPPLPPLDQELLHRALVLDKTPATGITDFDISKLAISPFSSATGGGSPGGGGGGEAMSVTGSGGNTNGHGSRYQNQNQNNNSNNQQNNQQQGGVLGVGGRSSLHFASRLHSGNNTGAESSNDDSTYMRFPLKKKKKRVHSLSPTGNGSPTDVDLKRRKKSQN